MVRTAITALVLTAFVVSSAGAVRVTTPAKPPARAASGKSTVPSSHRASHAVPRHASHSAHRSATHVLHPAKKTSTVKRTNLRRNYTSARSLGLKTVPRTSSQPRRDAEPPAALPASPAAELSRETTVTAVSAPEVVPPAQLESETAPSVTTTNPFNEPIDVGRLFESASSSVASGDKLGRYALRGSRDSLIRQNERSEADALERIEDDADLADRIARGVLVHVPESPALAVNPSLPEDRRYCRPWTASFLTDLARAHDVQFHKPLMVSSAVRTVEYQRHLMRRNHNAAAAEGDIVSPHLTGATIDIAKSGLSRRELAWMRDRLLSLQNKSLIDVEEEFRQACFHITVYKEYVPEQPSRAPTKLAAEADDHTTSGDPVSSSQ
jgi:Family of unknown function (DUF5715)